MKKTVMLAAMLAALSSVGVQAKDFNLQSAFPKNTVIIGDAADYFAKRVSVMTAGSINFKHLGAGELSPPFELLDNVGSGAIPAGWSYAAYAAGKAPAAALFGSIPFGPDATKYMSWVYAGGGLELWRETYAKFNVVPMPCGAIISEAGGWYRKPIQSVADLKGMKIRIGGLGGQVLAKVGAVPQNIAVGEIYTSLETGRLDATEMGTPMMDLPMGFDKVAKHYYFPGWHQPSGFIEFYVNKKVWDGWTEQQRTIVDSACRDVTFWTVARASGLQQAALDEARKRGVKVERFPESVIEALRKAADEVYAEQSAKDPMFKKVIDSYRAYSKQYDEYRKLNQLD
ncbi:MAG: hypothetical protein RLZZ153_380 [Pseudomonadota bacterium]|jgi:TRAP-type mannitol/chloroaromatic compound transport system substrate-binding protein